MASRLPGIVANRRVVVVESVFVEGVVHIIIISQK